MVVWTQVKVYIDTGEGIWTRVKVWALVTLCTDSGEGVDTEKKGRAVAHTGKGRIKVLYEKGWRYE